MSRVVVTAVDFSSSSSPYVVSFPMHGGTDKVGLGLADLVPWRLDPAPPSKCRSWRGWLCWPGALDSPSSWLDPKPIGLGGNTQWWGTRTQQ
jgi:hypothetical protein